MLRVLIQLGYADAVVGHVEAQQVTAVNELRACGPTGGLGELDGKRRDNVEQRPLTLLRRQPPAAVPPARSIRAPSGLHQGSSRVPQEHIKVQTGPDRFSGPFFHKVMV